jgi:hypothetical protein
MPSAPTHQLWSGCDGCERHGRPERGLGSPPADRGVACCNRPGGVVLLGAVMLLHIVRGEIDPLRRVMSEYANGSHGPVMTVVFYAFGLTSLALAVRLLHAFERRGAAKLISLLLALAGLSLIASTYSR